MLEQVLKGLGERRDLVPTLMGVNFIVFCASVLAFGWRADLEALVSAQASPQIALRTSVLIAATLCYNAVFFSGRNLTLISTYLAGHVLFFGAYDFLLATASGGLVLPHLIAIVIRLVVVTLILRIWMDDYFGRNFQPGLEAERARARAGLAADLPATRAG